MTQNSDVSDESKVYHEEIENRVIIAIVKFLISNNKELKAKIQTDSTSIEPTNEEELKVMRVDTLAIVALIELSCLVKHKIGFEKHRVAVHVYQDSHQKKEVI